MQSCGRFVVIHATERENNGPKCRKGLEKPSQGTRVPISFEEAHPLGQVRAVSESALHRHRVSSGKFNN